MAALKNILKKDKGNNSLKSLYKRLIGFMVKGKVHQARNTKNDLKNLKVLEILSRIDISIIVSSNCTMDNMKKLQNLFNKDCHVLTISQKNKSIHAMPN